MIFYKSKNTIYYFPQILCNLKKNKIRFKVQISSTKKLIFVIKVSKFLLLSSSVFWSNSSMPMVTHFLLYSLFLKTVSGYLQGYKQQLHLKGRGLKATLFERSLLFKLERSNKIIFTLPSNLQVNIIKFQSINFISTNYWQLKNLIQKIYWINPLNPYTTKGFWVKKLQLKKKKKSLY